MQVVPIIGLGRHGDGITVRVGVGDGVGTIMTPIGAGDIRDIIRDITTRIHILIGAGDITEDIVIRPDITEDIIITVNIILTVPTAEAEAILIEAQAVHRHLTEAAPGRGGTVILIPAEETALREEILTT